MKKPKIIILDEATSALDKMNEKLVQDAIENYRKKIGSLTIVVIAHRLSTIKDADKIVVLNKGQLVEQGTHDQILKEHPDGTYAGFVSKQQSAETNNHSATPVKEKEESPAKTKASTEKSSNDVEMKTKVD